MSIKSEPITYEVSEHGDAWHVLRGTVLYGDFLTRGDAVRGACFGARTDEARGRAAQVLAGGDGQPLSQYEPHFGS